MPEYLSPGVYIEEVSFRAKTIEGVSTSTAGFVGPTRFGPTKGEPEILTSFADFERIYGSLDQVGFEPDGDGALSHNFLAHAVRAFFDEGGKRLYVARVFREVPEGESLSDPESRNDGKAFAIIPGLLSPLSEDIEIEARYPGSGGNLRVTFTARVGQNVLAGVPVDPANPSGEKEAVLRGVSTYDLVWITDKSSPIDSPPGTGTLYWAERFYDTTTRRNTWRFWDENDIELPISDLTPGTDEVRVVSLAVEVTFLGRSPSGRATRTEGWDNLAFHPEHPRSLERFFGAALSSRAQELTIPIVYTAGPLNGPAVARTLLGQGRLAEEEPRLLRILGLPPGSDVSILATLGRTELSDADRRVVVQLEHGHDGQRPQAGEYEGVGDDDPNELTGLKAFENIADISIVAAPGYSHGYFDGYQADADQIARHLIGHCERMRYRIAVLDSANGQTISEVRAYRGQLDSRHAALYYPWVKILDPVTEEEILLPPSGYVAGIYARNDVEQGVHKAPANEVVRSAIGLELMLNKAQQDVLNPEGVNCFRFFEGRGYRLWGARTISSDPEWKYVNLRRYFAYLERSIERGTQWVVFENNHDPLWANVRRTVEDFLFNEWKSGHLMGEKPQEAYFVRCDRSTMTQNDIDNGRLICLIGIAPVRPAEFVIFRIGQWTADRRS